MARGWNVTPRPPESWIWGWHSWILVQPCLLPDYPALPRVPEVLRSWRAPGSRVLAAPHGE